MAKKGLFLKKVFSYDYLIKDDTIFKAFNSDGVIVFNPHVFLATMPEYKAMAKLHSRSKLTACKVTLKGQANNGFSIHYWDYDSKFSPESMKNVHPNTFRDAMRNLGIQYKVQSYSATCYLKYGAKLYGKYAPSNELVSSQPRSVSLLAATIGSQMAENTTVSIKFWARFKGSKNVDQPSLSEAITHSTQIPKSEAINKAVDDKLTGADFQTYLERAIQTKVLDTKAINEKYVGAMVDI